MENVVVLSSIGTRQEKRGRRTVAVQGVGYIVTFTHPDGRRLQTNGTRYFDEAEQWAQQILQAPTSNHLPVAAGCGPDMTDAFPSGKFARMTIP